MENKETKTTNNGNKKRNFQNRKKPNSQVKNNQEKKVQNDNKELNIPRAEKVIAKLPKANGRRKTTGPKRIKKKT